MFLRNLRWKSPLCNLQKNIHLFSSLMKWAKSLTYQISDVRRRGENFEPPSPLSQDRIHRVMINLVTVPYRHHGHHGHRVHQQHKRWSTSSSFPLLFIHIITITILFMIVNKLMFNRGLSLYSLDTPKVALSQLKDAPWFCPHCHLRRLLFVNIH